jgi:hypothetical protein
MDENFFIDAAERAVWTFVEAAAGALLVSGLMGLDAYKGALIAGIAAALSVIKSTARKALRNRKVE